MSIQSIALQSPTSETLQEWLDTPRVAKCGAPFTPSQPMWRPDPTVLRVNWKVALRCVEQDWQPWLHAALASYMSQQAQNTMTQLCSTLSRCAQSGLNPLREPDLMALVDRFNPSDFAGVATFIGFWAEGDHEKRPSKTLVEAYAKIPRKKRVKSDVVQSLDPEKGPLTQPEQDALFQWLHYKFIDGQINSEQFIYLRLKMIYGQRGVQLRMLVFGDFLETDWGLKVRMFFAKQKEYGASWRTKSELFSLDPEFYRLIQGYKVLVLQRLQQEYPDRANWERAIDHVPLFKAVVKGRGRVKGGYPVMVDSDDMHLLETAPQAKFHIGAGSVKAWLARIQAMPDFPISPRTHAPTSITNEHRFRHTLGTDLATAGFPETAISKALMHTSNRSVRQYIQVSPELLRLVDDKLNDHIALVVHAFTGRIVTDREAAKNGDNPERQIQDLAVCGADAVCHLDAPYTCYACPKFQPLLDADHTSVLKRLEARREAIKEQSDKTTQVLWDNAILACREVILRCRAQTEEDKNA